MGIEEIFADGHHQILKAQLPAGGVMPRHYATSDAFVIIAKGKAEIVFDDMKSEITGGTTYLIPERKPHRLEIKEDFEAYIILAPEAKIEGAGKKVAPEQEPA